LFKALEKIPNLKVYYKENVPERLHFSKNERIGEPDFIYYNLI
jgi:hypothetical protein